MTEQQRAAANLARYELRFRAGEPWALFEAAKVCLDTGIGVPEWIRLGFVTGWARWESGEAASLAEAYGIGAPPGGAPRAARIDALSALIRHKVEQTRSVAGLSRKGKLPRAFLQQIAVAMNDDFGTKLNAADIARACR